MQADDHCCYIHIYAKLKVGLATDTQIAHLKLGLRDFSKDHATLRSATARETHVKSRTAVKDPAVRKAIVACIYADVKR